MTGQLALDFRLASDTTLENYVGKAAAKLTVLRGIGYLWGEPESGRSHLLQALCHAASEEDRSAIYLENPRAYGPAVLDGLESMSVIGIDDIERVLGDCDWELALFHLINAVNDRGGYLVICGSRPAKRLSVELKDLRSRLNSAVAVQTDRLSDSEKLEVLKQRARLRSFTLNDEVGRYMMGRAPRSMRTLMDMLERLEVETLVRQKKVTIPLVKETLGI